MTEPTLPTPTQLARKENDSILEITWSNGEVREYRIRSLRDRCPCATCREHRNAPAQPGQLTVLKLEETQPLRVTSMKPVGNYAYGIAFSDGHDTGIFTLESLWNWESSP